MCEETLKTDYDNKIVDLATKIQFKQAIDSNQVVCASEYLKAKRYSKLLTYLSQTACCPTNTKNEIIEKLNLASKF